MLKKIAGYSILAGIFVIIFFMVGILTGVKIDIKFLTFFLIGVGFLGFLSFLAWAMIELIYFAIDLITGNR